MTGTLPSTQGDLSPAHDDTVRDGAATQAPRPAGLRAAWPTGPGGRLLSGELLATLGFVVGVVAPHTNAGAAWAIAFLLTVPGDLCRRALGLSVTGVGERLALAVAASCALQMFTTLICEILVLLAGHRDPLALAVLLPAELAMVAALMLLARRPAAAAPGPWPRVDWAVPGLFLVFPLMAYVGVGRFDGGRGPAVLGVALVGAAALVLATLVMGGDWLRRVGPFALYGLSLTILWAISLRSETVYGWDIHAELAVLTQTLDHQQWAPQAGNAYQAMLSITAVPTVMTVLTGIAPLTYLKVVAPLIFSVYPVGVYALLSRFGPRRVALALTVWLVLTSVGFWQLGSVARQQTGLLLGLGVVLSLTAKDVGRVPRVVFAALLGVGCVVAHYSTAYILVAVLLVASLGWLVVGLAARLVRGRPARRGIPLALGVLLLAASLIWNNLITQSGGNLSETAARLQSNGMFLRSDSSLLDSWLKGTGTRTVPVQQFFAATDELAKKQPWLQTYDKAAQADFVTHDIAPTNNLPDGAWGKGSALVDLGYTLGRQLTNLGLALAVLAAWLAAIRGRSRSRAAEVAAWLAIAALFVTLLMRVSTSLSLDYNAERLAIQTYPLLAMTVVGPFGAVVHARRALWRRLGAVALVALALAGLGDATGMKAVAFPGYGDSLINQGESYQRYFFDRADIAAEHWLAGVWQEPNIVFTDNYGQLMVVEDPNVHEGLFNVLAPPVLDQRAYVFATTENYAHGRVRASYQDLWAMYAFPRGFFDKYKQLIYSNGQAAVYG